MYNENEVALIVLDSLYGLDYKQKVEVIKAIGQPKNLLAFSSNVFSLVSKAIGDNKASTVRLAFNKDFIEKTISEIDQRELVAVTYLSNDYPLCLKQNLFFPLVLYAKGNLNLLKSENKFAIVGSRKTLPYAIKFATETSKELSERGAVIVTGSAVGGDRAAILGAIESGNIISVLAHGHDNVYPETNRELIAKVEKKGLVITEYPFSVAARNWMFPVRNRIIAALSKGVLIVSGELDSGARHTANYALEYNRDVFALPYSIGITSGQLCNDLIKNGAYLCDSVADIENCLDLKKIQKFEIQLEPDEQKVYDAIKDGHDDAVKLINECNLKIFELTPIISSLEIKGLVVKLIGNKFKSVK